MSPVGVDVSSVSSVSFKSGGSSVSSASSVGSVSSESSESSLCGGPIFISDMMVFLSCIQLISLNSGQRTEYLITVLSAGDKVLMFLSRGLAVVMEVAPECGLCHN